MAKPKGILLPILYKDDPKGLRDAQKRMKKFQQTVGKAAAVGFAAAGAAATAFAVSSVRAFAEAEQAQIRLEFAFERFPKLADTNVDALNRLNQALMRKTRFDDDAISSAQALLAQFDLTGQQIIDLTPLLLDYAARTGQDVTSAAESLGRAMLGQGRALKAVGIDFKDTGTVAGNFDQIMQGLREQVGGFAEKDAETAAGKLENMRNRFGEVQEAVGEALLPALEKIVDWIESDGLPALEGFAEWFAADGVDAITGFIDKISELSENGTLVPTIVSGLAAITTAQLTLNGAMFANPVGIVIGTLLLLVTQISAVIANLDAFRIEGENSMFLVALAVGGLAGVIAALVVNWDLIWGTMAAAVTHAINGVLHAVNFLLRGLQPVVDVFNFLFGTKFKLEFGLLKVPRIPGVYTGTTQQGANNSQRRGSVAMAEGGVVLPRPGGTLATIGEAGEAEAVMPLSWLEGQVGGSGMVVNVTVNAGMGTDGTAVGREIVAQIKRYERSSGRVFARA